MSNLSYVLVCVLIMAVVSYLPRVLPMVLVRNKLKSPFLRSFLSYIPYAVLAAMIIPDAITATSSVLSAVVGLLVAIVLAYFGKGLLLVAICSAGSVFVCEWGLRLMGYLS